MCIALPRRIVAVDESTQSLILAAEAGEADEVVSAALILADGRQLAGMVGGYAICHAGFALSLVDAAEALSRLQVFDAVRGGDGPIDMDDFYREQVETPESGTGGVNVREVRIPPGA